MSQVQITQLIFLHQFILSIAVQQVSMSVLCYLLLVECVSGNIDWQTRHITVKCDTVNNKL